MLRACTIGSPQPIPSPTGVYHVGNCDKWEGSQTGRGFTYYKKAGHVAQNIPLGLDDFIL